MSSAPVFSTELTDTLSRCADRWNACDGLEETTLLRLSILRDLMREMHAEKSRSLANGKREEAQGFRAWETRIDNLRSATRLKGSLTELLADPRKITQRARLLPEGLFACIEKEKFDRFDRAWETALAAEAAALGWTFWTLDAWVRITEAESFHRELADRLSPDGVVLFAESAPAGAITAPPPDSGETASWFGRWVVVLKSRFRIPEVRVREFPGVSLEQAEPLWRLLYATRPPS